jgi:bacteriorhodopsin
MGIPSGVAYFLIVYEIWIGEAAKLAKLPVETLAAHKILCWFVLVGWAIYPLGYMLGTDGWYTGQVKGSVDAVYNS